MEAPPVQTARPHGNTGRAPAEHPQQQSAARPAEGGLSTLLGGGGGIAADADAVQAPPRRKKRRSKSAAAKAEPKGRDGIRLKDQPRRSPDRPYKSMTGNQSMPQEDGDGGLGGRKSAKKAVLSFAAMFIVGGMIAAGVFLWPKFMGGETAVTENASGEVKPIVIAKNPDGTAAGSERSKVVETIVPAKPNEEGEGESGSPAAGSSGDEGAANPMVAKTVEKKPAQRPAKSVSSNNPTPPPVLENADYADAKAALETFLTAKNIEERLPFVHIPEKIEKAMEEYYGRHPQGIEPTRIDFQLSNKLRDSQRRFFVFEVTTKQQTDPFPVSVEETDKGYKLDWRLFIEFHDNLLGQYLRIYQQQSDQFRVMLERAHYFRNDIPDLGNKLCFRIRPPMLGHEGYAFVNADSALGKELENKFDWDVLYMPIVELKWVHVDGWKYIELTKIVQDNWRTSF